MGYTLSRERLQSRNKNHQSSMSNTNVVDESIASEITASRLLGPIQHQISAVHISPLGLVPKSHQVNKWRTICDLLSPRGHSVNDGIPPVQLFATRYASTSHPMVSIEVVELADVICSLSLVTWLINKKFTWRVVLHCKCQNVHVFWESRKRLVLVAGDH